MTLQEAIKHAEEKGQSDCTPCAKEHLQLAKWLRELQDLRRENRMLKAQNKRLEDDDSRSLFHRLFYREQIGRLLQRLRLEDSLRRKGKRGPGHFLNLRDLIKILASTVERAEDETKCNVDCKGMYFCEEKRGHKDGHHEYGLGPWD